MSQHDFNIGITDSTMQAVYASDHHLPKALRKLARVLEHTNLAKSVMLLSLSLEDHGYLVTAIVEEHRDSLPVILTARDREVLDT